MSLDAFLAEVRDEAADLAAQAAQAQRGASLLSAYPGEEALEAASGDAGNGTAEMPAEPLRQGRARGNLPRRILPQGMDEPDLQ